MVDHTPRVALGDAGDHVLAVDIGGTNLRLGLVRRDLAVDGFEIVGSQDMLQVADPLHALGRLVGEYLARHTPGRGPLAVAMGFPGTVDRARRTVLSTSNIESLQNVPIADYLESVLGVPAVIDRDVNNVLRYDLWDLDVPTAGIVVGCYVGTGLGNGISIEGRILVGRHGVAGELGHLPGLGLTGRCGCGNIGCIETVASGRYFGEMAAAYFPDTPMHHVLSEHVDHPKVREFIRHIATAIASEVNILDPEAVILGGGVVAAPGFPIEALEAEVRQLARKPLPANDIRFLHSTGGQLAGVIGAGISAWDALALQDPPHLFDTTAGSIR